VKQVQIDEKLFFDIAKYVIIAGEGEEMPSELRNRVIEGIYAKLEKIESRALYTQYKTSSSEERETARQAYLNYKNILPDWRTEKEKSMEEL
jgi:hypothetical protein